MLWHLFGPGIADIDHMLTRLSYVCYISVPSKRKMFDVQGSVKCLFNRALKVNK